MAQILSPHFLSSAGQTDFDNELDDLGTIYYEDFESVMQQEDNPDCLISWSGVMFRGIYFLLNQRPYLEDRLQQENDENASPLKSDLMRSLQKTIDELHIDYSTELFAFDSEPVEEIYRREIVFKRELTFDRHNSKTLDYKSRPVIHYDLILPFHAWNYNESAPCYSRRELPMFFKNKVSS